MADDNKSSGILRNTRGMNKQFDLLDQKINSMYKDTYISRPDDKENIDRIVDKMDLVIDKLQGADTSASGMSELLRRVDKDRYKNTQKYLDEVNDLFNNQQIMGSLLSNQDIHDYINGQNYNYDLICKYLPRLQDALEIKRDNVLCSDNIDKKFLNPKANKSSKDEIKKFNANVNALEREYEISEFFEQTYMNASKYGEDFIYIVPYNIAFQRMFRRAQHSVANNTVMYSRGVFESYYSKPQKVLTEGYNTSSDFNKYIKSDEVKANLVLEEGEVYDNLFKDIKLGEVNLHFNESGIISTAVNEHVVLREKADVEKFQSLAEAYFGTGEVVNEEAKPDMVTVMESREGLNNMFSNVVKRRNLDLNKTHNQIGADGLIVTNKDRDPDKIDKDFYGAVVERIPRQDIIPIYIGKKCFGYYYLEFAEDPTACGYCGGHHTTPLIGGNVSRVRRDLSENQEELAVRYIASKMSQAIDTKFINANKDLKEEIYAVLRYNEKFDITRTNNIGITFIPAEDIVHCYLKINEHTHRGISDLERSVVPGMLYILLYLTDIIGKVSRSNDKRVYYVKQNVETNIARTMMNVVQQIKKGNMGMRQIESMNNILNIVGKYNDYVISVGPSGDPPEQFEVMQGQQIETPTDIMEKMEEAAVNPIMPIELVNSTYQQDFATKYTMSNSRFVRMIFTAQRKTEAFFSKMYTKIYNYEYMEKNDWIQVVLPPPTYLIFNNNQQIIDQVTQTADKIVEIELADEEEEVKTEWKKLYTRQTLASYIDFENVDNLREQARVNVELAKNVAASDDDVNDMMDDSL